MTTRCYDLERRVTSLLVKADMKEHIEKALRQFCQKGKNLLLRLLKRVCRSSSLDLFQCVGANVLKPNLVLGLVFLQAAVLRVYRQSCLFSVPSKQPPECGERRTYSPVGCVFPRLWIGGSSIHFQPLKPAMGLIGRRW